MTDETKALILEVRYHLVQATQNFEIAVPECPYNANFEIHVGGFFEDKSYEILPAHYCSDEVCNGRQEKQLQVKAGLRATTYLVGLQTIDIANPEFGLDWAEETVKQEISSLVFLAMAEKYANSENPYRHPTKTAHYSKKWIESCAFKEHLAVKIQAASVIALSFSKWNDREQDPLARDTAIKMVDILMQAQKEGDTKLITEFTGFLNALITRK